MNKYKNNYILFFLIFLFGTICSYSQVGLRPLSGNPNLFYNQSISKKTLVSKTLSLSPDTLPFFDDFYYASQSPYPTVKHWLDSNVYINTGFAYAPLSIGVATFDGLNKYGYPYNFYAASGTSGNADTLTSRPINIQNKNGFFYSVADSIYLSFYYQPQGKGDPPEAADSLLLDFYKPNQKVWSTVWKTKGFSLPDSAFYFAIVPINDTAYIDSLFQFRFRNKASQSGNMDHWNLDYVYINKDRTIADTLKQDIAFAYRSSSLLKNYSAIPYEQFVASEMSLNFNNYIRNNDYQNISHNINYQFSIFDNNHALLINNNVGSCNIKPFFPDGYLSASNVSCSSLSHPSIGYTLPLPLTDTASYMTKHFFTAQPDVVTQNDTFVDVLHFGNYYAYDDGTAELAFYNNTYGAKCAERFTLNVNDTLRALDIYFDPFLDNNTIQGSSFRICVWSASGSAPGNTLIYKDSLVYPKYLNWGYNAIPRYTLTSGVALTAGSYFIGIQQTTNKGLNIGFDVNTNHKDALYYDVGFGWQQSTYDGSLMMHPVFGKTGVGVAGINEITSSKKSFTLFPNPAQNSIQIKNHHPDTFSSVEIYSVIGQPVLTQLLENNITIDVSSLPNGVYFVYLSSDQTKSAPEKLIISR